MTWNRVHFVLMLTTKMWCYCPLAWPKSRRPVGRGVEAEQWGLFVQVLTEGICSLPKPWRALDSDPVEFPRYRPTANGARRKERREASGEGYGW